MIFSLQTAHWIHSVYESSTSFDNTDIYVTVFQRSSESPLNFQSETKDTWMDSENKNVKGD